MIGCAGSPTARQTLGLYDPSVTALEDYQAGRRTVDSLSEELRGELAAEGREVQELELLIGECIPTLLHFFQPGPETWPYQLVDEKLVDLEGRYSESTTAMITFALSALGGRVQDSQLVPSVPQGGDFYVDESSLSVVDRATGRLAQELRREATRGGDETRTRSSVFGKNDPFTLMWVFELLRVRAEQGSRASGVGELVDLDQIRSDLLTAANEVVERALSRPLEPILIANDTDSDFTPVVHSFPLLRTVQLAKLLQQIDRANPPPSFNRVRDHFFNQLYAQISFDEIRDSLVFRGYAAGSSAVSRASGNRSRMCSLGRPC